MKRLIVRYKVNEDKARQNIEYIQGVFRALETSKPKGLRYASFPLEDRVNFVHIASSETGDGSNPLAAFDEFKAFTKDNTSSGGTSIGILRGDVTSDLMQTLPLSVIPTFAVPFLIVFHIISLMKLRNPEVSN